MICLSVCREDVVVLGWSREAKPGHALRQGNAWSALMLCLYHHLYNRERSIFLKPLSLTLLIFIMSAANTSNHANSSIGQEKNASSMRNSRWRELKADEIKMLMDELNAKRTMLNMPEVTFTLPKVSLKGTKKPNYNPPTEMSQDDLKKWKANERKKRKAAMQRENRRRKAELLKSFKVQLVVLDKMIEDQKKVLEKAVKAIESLDCGNVVSMDDRLKSAAVISSAAADLHVTPVTAKEEDELLNSLAGLDDIDASSWDNGEHTPSVPSNETVDVPNKVIFHTHVSTLDDLDDSSCAWADGNSVSLDEDFDVPFADIFDD